jgi:hypothetical protein
VEIGPFIERGRLTLIKSTLSNLPTYLLSLFPIPSSVANRLEKVQRNFLWGSTNETTKFHLVKWTSVCSPMKDGGLGIRNLRRFNQALLGKWLWRYATEKEAYWRKVVEIKYGSMEGDWCTKQVERPFGVGVWKHIRRGWELFSKFIRFEVGDGTRIRFWQDVWCGDQPLKESFSVLFRIARNKEAWVSDHMQITNEEIHWNVQFFREVQDWEVEVVLAFYSKLYETRRHVGRVDRICWTPAKRKCFEVSSFFGVLSPVSDRYEVGCSSFPWKGIWKVKVPFRVSFFIWTASLGKILTLDNLRKRGLIVMDWCCMCKRSGESINHLLLHCEVACSLWSVIFTLFEVKWVMNGRVLDLMACWKGQRGNKMVMKVWRMAPLCLMS